MPPKKKYPTPQQESQSAWSKIKTSAEAKKRPCSSPGCNKFQIAKGFCWGHYQRFRRGLATDTPLEVAKHESSNVVQLTGVKVPVEIEAYLKWRVAEAKVSVYSLVQRIVEEWYANEREKSLAYATPPPPPKPPPPPPLPPKQQQPPPPPPTHEPTA